MTRKRRAVASGECGPSGAAQRVSPMGGPRPNSRVRSTRAVQSDASVGEAMSELDIGIIQRLLPHRYPMLLVDRVLDWEAGKFVRGVKNVTINEPFFQGHFPAYPVMPGVLVIEAMAQVAGL